MICDIRTVAKRGVSMGKLEKAGKGPGKVVLILCNIALMIAAVLFTVKYSDNVRASQEQMMRDSFCNTVETMKQISERYLDDEWNAAKAWAAYIEREHMSMDDALAYVRTISAQQDCEAHIVDMDTFEARSSKPFLGSDSISVYNRYFHADNPEYNTDGAWSARATGYIQQLRNMFAGKKDLLGRYTLLESQRSVISVGTPVTLRQQDGTDRAYLLLRVIPVESIKKLWLFPVNYSSAEIGLIAVNGDYVIPSYSMRSENFVELIRYYNFQDNFNGVEEMLSWLAENQSGLMTFNNARYQECYWYYTRLDGFEGLDLIGYIPTADLTTASESISIVLVVAGVLLMIGLIDGLYILSINHRLRIAARVAGDASNAKTQFLSSMSHDIRTPLNAVLGMTELAQSHANDPAYVQECLRKIAVSGGHLLTLINDILEISRVESGKISINPAPFDVAELTAGLESITRSQALGRGLDFDVTLEPLPYPYLTGDKLRLTQVYLNLLTNAVKYTHPGGSIHLEMREDSADDGVVLVCIVSDTGMGMSPEFQKTMYDSFTREADSRVDKTQGTGLGLAIVKRMVMLMNGSIDCVSAPGKGTTFTVCIPLKIADKADMPVTMEIEQDGHNSLEGVRILVAEDNDLNWEIAETLLDGYGIRCERAENGRECVDKLTAAPPDTYDLVLMDVQMPVMNGREAAKELRASTRRDLRQIPIAAMTADAFAEDVQSCIDAGMDAHIAKPLEMEKALATIRLLLTRKHNADGRQG